MKQLEDTHKNPPASPTLRAPSHAALVDGAAVSFEWEAAEGAMDYRVDVASDASFQAVVFSQAIPAATSLTVYDVFPSDKSTLYWRVIARNSAGESPSTTTGQFVSGGYESAPQQVSSSKHVERVPVSPSGAATPIATVGPLAPKPPSDRFETYYEGPEEGGIEHEGLPVGGILSFVYILIFIIAVAVVTVSLWAQKVADETRQEVTATLTYPALREVDAQGQSLLQQYSKVPGQEGVYRLPIEQAMELIVQEAAQTPAAAYSTELPLK